MHIETTIPAHVRQQVAAEGAATWRRTVPGGALVLVTRRHGTKTTTIIEGVELDAPASDAEEALKHEGPALRRALRILRGCQTSQGPGGRCMNRPATELAIKTSRGRQSPLDKEVET